MADEIIPVRQMVYVQDVSSGRAVSESVGQKLASGINFINKFQIMRLNFGAIGSYYSGAAVMDVGLSEIVEFDSEIVNCWITNGISGTSGVTEVDLKKQTLGATTWTSLFSTTPKFDSTSVNGSRVDTAGKVSFVPIGPLGASKPVLASTLLNAGDTIRFDLLQAMVGGSNIQINLHIRPR